MNIEDRIQSESLKLSDFYYPYYYKKHRRAKNQVYNKYKDFFIKAAGMFCIRDGYDAERLINSFMLDGFKYPQQLCNETVWNTYISYMPGLSNKKEKDIEVVENIVNAGIILKRSETVENWLSKKINQISLQQNNAGFDLTLFSFSYYFINYCKLLHLNIDIKKLRNSVFSLNEPTKTKVLNKIKILLKDDYYKTREEDDKLIKEMKENGFIF